MRQRFLRELKNNLENANVFWDDDIKDIIHIANMTFKKCTKDLKEYKRNKKEDFYKKKYRRCN